MISLADIKITQMAWALYIMDNTNRPHALDWEKTAPFVQDAYRKRVKNICYTLSQYPPETTVKILTEAREWTPK